MTGLADSHLRRTAELPPGRLVPGQHREPTPIPQVAEVREPQVIRLVQNLYSERTVVPPPAPAVPPRVTTARVPPPGASVSTMAAPCAAAISRGMANPRPADPLA